MTTASTAKLTTLEALSSTIKHDSNTLWWFASLIVQPRIRASFSREDNQPVNSLYPKLTNLLALRILIYVSQALLIGWYILSSGIWLLALVIILLMGLFQVEKIFRNIIQETALALVTKDFPGGQLNQKTLFQISEFYSREYQIPSLVDNIVSWDNAGRLLVLTGLLCMQQLFPILTNLPQFPLLVSLILIITLSHFIFYLFKTIFLLLKMMRCC